MRLHMEEGVAMPFSKEISSHEDLVTTYAARRAGFIALERNRRADPFVEEAKVLRSLARQANKPADLLSIDGISASLLTAAGVSEKAGKHLQESDKQEAVAKLIEAFLEPAGEDFLDELVYRFLLTRGDALGGSMRNIAGRVGEQKFTKTLVSTISVAGLGLDYLDAAANKWERYGHGRQIGDNVKGLHWKSGQGDRTLIYNLTVPAVSKNVDLCLLACKEDQFFLQKKGESAHEQPNKYVALGEIKGGIDPAGADEHWKTANTALGRIRAAFAAESSPPKTFFVGAAIESAMAKEIYQQLEDNTLAHAANLTDEHQVVALCQWLINL